MPHPAYSAPAVDAALSILETLASIPQIGVSQLAKKLNLSKGSVYRLLNALLRRGYVEKAADSDRYQLTYRLFAVGSRAADRLGLREVAQPVMERLRSETGETVNLGVLDGFRTVSVHLAPSARPLSIHMRIGGVSAHATSTGKILLAALDPEELARRLAGRRLESLTERTIRSRRALLAELGHVRAQGYALDDEECSLGLRCVGAPVRNHRGAIVAALSLVGPTQRVSRDGLPAWVAMVRGAADEISRRLGWPGVAAQTKEVLQAGRHESAAGGPDAGPETAADRRHPRGGLAHRPDPAGGRARDRRGRPAERGPRRRAVHRS